MTYTTFLPFSIIILAFCKEFIVSNHELIIYTTFLLLTLSTIYFLDFLVELFSSIGLTAQENLKIESQNNLNLLKKIVETSDYTLQSPNYLETYLKTIDDPINQQQASNSHRSTPSES